MKFRRDITVFIRKPSPKSIGWDVFKVKNALFTQTLEANSNISAKGFVPNSKTTIRFAPDKSFSIIPGDFIFPGDTDKLSPPPDSLSVLSVTGGDRGSKTLKLVKVVCG